MVNLEKLEKGTYFKDAFKVSYKYDPQTLNKIRQLSYRRYLPEEKAWEIPASELVHLIDRIALGLLRLRRQRRRRLGPHPR